MAMYMRRSINTKITTDPKEKWQERNKEGKGGQGVERDR
jgi:hypothetical protein